MFCFSKATSPAWGGWGRCQDPRLQPPPREAPSQLQSLNTAEQWNRREERRGGPSQTKALNPTPGLSSFLQVLCLDPLKPSKAAQHSLSLRGEGDDEEAGFWKDPVTLPESSHPPLQQISDPMPPQAVSLTCKSLETLTSPRSLSHLPSYVF